MLIVGEKINTSRKSVEEAVRKKDAAFEELKEQIAELAVNAAERIMKENIDANKNKELVNKYLGEITKN